MKTSNTSLLGTWQIEEMETWARDAFELLGPAFFEFRSGSWGQFRFIAVIGDMDCRVSTRDGAPLVEFSWQGQDDCHPATGRGWATVEGDQLQGHIYIHAGEDSAFTAQRTPEAPATPPVGADRAPDGESVGNDGKTEHHPVSLDSLLEEVEGLISGWRACLNTKTGEIASYGEDLSLGCDDDEEDYEGGEWLHLPFPDGDEDWRMMRDFASAQAGTAREALGQALNGSRPFRAFRAAAQDRGLQDAWYAHQQAEIRRLLTTWLEDNDVPVSEGGSSAR